MRQWLAKSFLSMVVLAATGAVPALADGEIIALRHTCQRPGVRVHVHVGPHSYPVVGKRDELLLPVCEVRGRAGQPGVCVPIAVHRFDMMCGGERVSWAEVSDAIAGLIRVSDQPLRLQATDGSGFGRRMACRLVRGAGKSRAQSDHKVLATDKIALPQYQFQCQSPDGLPTVRIDVPVGYAPVQAFGGRLESMAKAAAKPPSRFGIIQAIVTSTSLPDITPSGLVALTTADGEGSARTQFVGNDVTPQGLSAAKAVTLPEQLPDSDLRPGSETAKRWFEQPYPPALVLAAGLALSLIAWAGLKRGRGRSMRSLAARSLLSAIERAERVPLRVHGALQRLPRLASARQTSRVLLDPKAANAAAAVSAMLAGAQTLLDQIKSAGPLSDVLGQELSQLRQRLSALEAGLGQGPDQAARAAPGFRSLMRDIERVRRIADSAALSIGSSKRVARVPATKAEAYDLLGLNPDVADGTLKKVADGLRMSWHPDHARDDADRVQREARIKAINIAMDLINGKRAA